MSRNHYPFIHRGAQVHWHDPAIHEYSPEDWPALEARVFTVIDVPREVHHDSVILISDGISEAEVWCTELTPA